MKTKLKRGVMYLRGVHPDAKRQFRSIVTRRDDTMSMVVESLIRLYVKNPEIVSKELLAVKKSRKT